MSNDPAIRETFLFGKFYHYTWHLSRKTKRMQLTLHKGQSKACRRVHKDEKGNKA